MREAARVAGEPLSHTRYDTARAAAGGPSSTRIIQRFGSWRAACERAGVSPGAASGRSYSRAWTADQVVGWVREYLASGDGAGSYSGYQHWARSTAGAPSGVTVRNALGSWSEVKRAAGSAARSEESKTPPERGGTTSG